MMLPNLGSNVKPLEILLTRTVRKYRHYKFALLALMLIIISAYLFFGSSSIPPHHPAPVEPFRIHVITVFTYSPTNLKRLASLRGELAKSSDVELVVVYATNDNDTNNKAVEAVLLEGRPETKLVKVEALGTAVDPLLTLQRNTAIDWLYLTYPNSDDWFYFADLNYHYAFQTAIFPVIRKHAQSGQMGCAWFVGNSSDRMYHTMSKWKQNIVFPAFSISLKQTAKYFKAKFKMDGLDEHQTITAFLEELHLINDENNMPVIFEPQPSSPYFVIPKKVD